MALILIVLLLAILVGAVGFAVHVLWFVAIVLFAVWLIGFVARGGENARWYRW
jgi:hypothetical protein